MQLPITKHEAENAINMQCFTASGTITQWDKLMNTPKS